MTTPATPPVDVKSNAESVFLMSMFANQQKAALETRIEGLKKNGVTEDMIKEFVTPYMGLDVTTMSIADFDAASGKIKTLAQAELAISILEKQAAQIVTMSLDSNLDYFPEGGTEIGYSEPNTLSDEDKKNFEAFGAMLING